MSWLFSKKIASLFLVLCISLEFLPQHVLAADTEKTDETKRPMVVNVEKGEEALVSLMNFDGTEVFGKLTVEIGTVVTQEDLTEVVDWETSLRGAYTFVAWSLAMGDVTSSYVPTPSFTINEDTTLYAVYRPIEAGDIDVTMATDLINALETYSGHIEKLGLTLEDVAKAPQHDSSFYNLLLEYLEEHVPDAFSDTYGEAVATSDVQTAETLQTQRIAHAFEDAEWSLSRRPDLNYAQEVIFMYTSHYIDVQEPSSVTTIGHDSTLNQLYITDLDRRTYLTFYSEGSAVDVYSSWIKFFSIWTDVPSIVVNCSAALNSSNSRLYRIKKAFEALGSIFWDEYYSTSKKISKNVYLDIMSLQGKNREELFSQIDAILEQLISLLSIDYGVVNKDVAFGILYSALAAASGSGYIAILWPYIYFYTDLTKTFFDVIYYTKMRLYIQTRLAERMMYALGMSDGRN